MYNVSAEYKEQINKLTRNPSYVKVKFEFINALAKEDASLSANGETAFSDVSEIKEYEYIQRAYDTLELNRFILDNTHILATEDYTLKQGFVSENITNKFRKFSINPKLTLTFTELFNFSGLTLTFDESRGEFPTELSVKAYANSVLVFNETYNPTDDTFTFNDAIIDCNLIEIEFVKTAIPYRRIRLTGIEFGVVRTIDSEKITTATQEIKADLLSTVLPVNNFELKFIDDTGEYDPDNPEGIAGFIKGLQPVSIEYGYELDDGTIEWILAGNNYTTGEFNFESSGALGSVSLKTSNSLLNFLDDYIEGVYSPLGTSLYDLAEDILNVNGINYYLDDSLQSIYTNAPLPVLPKKECIQLIANAGQCVLDVDRDGTIRIYRPNYVLNDFDLNFNSSYSAPKVEKYPMLWNVNTYNYQYIPEDSITEITKLEVDVTSDTEFYIPYNLSTEISSTLDGTLTIVGTPEYYAYGSKVVLNGNGTIRFNGKKINITRNKIIKNFNIDGENATVENELITNLSDANSYATWIGNVLNLRNTYTSKNRGYPELDPADKITLETLYAEGWEVFVLSNKITYNGGLSGETVMLVTE